jgi:hypothetical protein
MTMNRAMAWMAWLLMIGVFAAPAANAQGLSGSMRSSVMGGQPAGLLARGPLAAAAAINVWSPAVPQRGASQPEARSRAALHRVSRRSPAAGRASRLTAGLALGVLGYLGGGLAGAMIAGRGEPALGGFVIGSSVGAGAGVAIGLLAAR